MDKDKKKRILTVIFKVAVALAALAFAVYTVYYFATIGKQIDKIKDKYEIVATSD